MEINYYINPAILIILLSLSILKWVYSIVRHKNPRGISAVIARLFLIYVYFSLTVDHDFTVKNRYFLITLGVSAILVDEIIFSISHVIGTLILNKLKRK